MRLRPDYPCAMATDAGSSVRFSVWPSPERPWSEVQALALYADSHDWHCLWYADHFMPNSETGEILDGAIYECWSMLSAVAAVTSKIRLGSLVSPTTFRHPALLANTAATIDRISNGRLVLGIGAGWQVNEHNAYGVDLLEGKDRVDRFEEAIRIIKSLLHNDRTNFAGTHFEFTNAPCQPQPLQPNLPIMVGTGGPRMSRITAALADEWNTWGDVPTAKSKMETFEKSCDQVGRDSREVRKSVQSLFFLVDDPDRAAKLRTVAPNDRSIIGSNDHIVEQLGLLAEMGFDEIIFPDFTLGHTDVERLENYEKIRTQILTQFA